MLPEVRSDSERQCYICSGPCCRPGVSAGLLQHLLLTCWCRYVFKMTPTSTWKEVLTGLGYTEDRCDSYQYKVICPRRCWLWLTPWGMWSLWSSGSVWRQRLAESGDVLLLNPSYKQNLLRLLTFVSASKMSTNLKWKGWGEGSKWFSLFCFLACRTYHG